MAKQKSTQQAIAKVRKPRVHISYEVETGGARLRKELPFVVGIVANLSGGQKERGERFRDRKFVEIDGENFSKVMNAVNPSLNLRVPDRCAGEGMVSVDIEFRDLDSFSPGAIAQAVPQLKRLLDTRAKLHDLLAKLDGNDHLNDLLAEVVHDSQVQLAAKASLVSNDKGGQALGSHADASGSNLDCEKRS